MKNENAQDRIIEKKLLTGTALSGSGRAGRPDVLLMFPISVFEVL